MTLADLPKQQSATIDNLITSNRNLARLTAFGFQPGKQIEVLHRQRFSKNLIVKIGHSQFSVRQLDAQQIKVNL